MEATARVPAEAATPAAAAPAKSDELVVTFRDVDRSCPFKKGQSICEIAEANGIKLSADCHAGICGSDPVRIVEGADRLNPMSDAERGTLEDICCVEPKGHRLACVSRPTGSVVVEFVQS